MNAKSATFALQISFLLGMQLILGQEPPIHRRSTTAVRLPALPHMPGQVLTALETAEDEDPQIVRMRKWSDLMRPICFHSVRR